MTTGPTGMLRSDGGYVAAPQDALRIWPTTERTNWVSVDPPRVWDMVRHEDDAMGWEQVSSLRSLATLLTAQADRLTRHRNALAQLWPAEHSQAAAMALNRIDFLIESMRADSSAAIQNALALDGIMTVTAKAKREVHQIVQQWETTTHEGGPEWWGREATRLSYVTEQTMEATEQAIRDHRGQIILPQNAQDLAPITSNPEAVTHDPDPAVGPATIHRTGDAPSPKPPLAVPPPLPGYPPLVTPLPSGLGPDLQGTLAPPIPATPGQPVSMLPIAPGSQFAPHGGAYVLPGPGVGQNGYVVALPQPGSNSAPTVSMPPRGGGNMQGVMPMPMGGPVGSPLSRGEGALHRRNGDTRWEVAQGVAPVIQPARLATSPDPTPEQTEEDFRLWFTQTAMPWRPEGDVVEQAPIVTIRRGAPDRDSP